MKLIKVVFSDAYFVVKMSYGLTKEGIWNNKYVDRWRVELFFQICWITVLSRSWPLKSQQQDNFPLILEYLDLKNRISGDLLNFDEDFNEITENIKDCYLLKYKLYFTLYPLHIGR